MWHCSPCSFFLPKVQLLNAFCSLHASTHALLLVHFSFSITVVMQNHGCSHHQGSPEPESPAPWPLVNWSSLLCISDDAAQETGIQQIGAGLRISSQFPALIICFLSDIYLRSGSILPSASHLSSLFYANL